MLKLFNHLTMHYIFRSYGISSLPNEFDLQKLAIMKLNLYISSHDNYWNSINNIYQLTT